jgi:hypothetical protein
MRIWPPGKGTHVAETEWAWIRNLFSADQVRKRGVVRRKRGDAPGQVDDHGLKQLIIAARKRGFHVIETGDQVVVLCNEGDIRVWC